MKPKITYPKFPKKLSAKRITAHKAEVKKWFDDQVKKATAPKAGFSPAAARVTYAASVPPGWEQLTKAFFGVTPDGSKSLDWDGNGKIDAVYLFFTLAPGTWILESVRPDGITWDEQSRLVVPPGAGPGFWGAGDNVDEETGQKVRVYRMIYEA